MQLDSSMDVSLVPASTRIWVEVRTQALRHNLRVIQSDIGSAAKIIAVVKANAYGHGVGCVIPAIRDQVAVFAVANVEEAEAIQSLSRPVPVFILGPCLPAERPAAVRLGAIVTISSSEEARAFAELASAARPIDFVFKIDTGMGRIGALPATAEFELRKILALPHLRLHSVSTHLPSADEDVSFSTEQLEGFARFVESVGNWCPGVKAQVLNSAGALGFSGHAGQLVRAGLAIYGIAPLASHQSRLEPALTWKARVVQVRELPANWGISYGRTFITNRPTRVATIAAGYADGYPRQVSGKGAFVLVHGKRCPLLGRVTMDQIMVDATEVPQVAAGDEAVLLGRQGDGYLSATQVAKWADTIAWDIFTGIGTRPVRFADAG